MSKWIAEFDLEDGDAMPEHMDLEYKGLRIDFHCKPLEQEPCEDCISKKAVLDKINEVCFSREQESVNFRVAQGSNGQRDLIINFIENLPSVKPKPKTGYWITYEITQGGINEEWKECSVCMCSNALVIPRNYCPNCGCKMEVIGDDNRRSN